MSAARLEPSNAVDAVALDCFLRRFFPAAKADFLRDHGEWWHRGAENRAVVTLDGGIAGYCAVIPTKCLLGGAPRDAVWWVDLVVAPEHRGRGFQRICDTWVRKQAPLVLGFPNALAAGIHRRHGWGVRDDLKVLMAPIRPMRVPALRARHGGVGVLLRAAATCAEPLAALMRARLLRCTANCAWEVTAPEARELAEVFARNQRGDAPATTWRDERHISWRYLEAPERGQLRFFAAGDHGVARQILIARLLERGGARCARILDHYGDFSEPRLARGAVLLALGAAVADGAVQVTALASNREVAASLRRLGFVLSAAARFCWLSDDALLMGALEQVECHWTLADSDNDEP